MQVPTVSLSCALTLLAMPSSAQLLYDGQATHSIPVPTATWGGSAAPAEKSLGGDIHGDGLGDLVVQAGSTLSVAVGAGYHTAWAELTDPVTDNVIPVNDFDLVAGAGANGGDAIAYVDANGLHVAVYDETLYDAQNPQRFFASTLVEAGLWAGAQHIVIGAFGGTDLGAIGIDAAGTGLLVRSDLDAGTTTYTTPVATSTIPVLCLTAFDYDNDGTREPTVFTTDGILILSASTLATVVALPSPMVAASAAPFRQNASTERLAAVTRTSNGLENLFAYDSTGLQATALGATHTQGIAIGDIDQDGDDDLALAHRVDHTGNPSLMHHGVTIFPNNGPSQTFGGNLEEVDMGAGPIDPGSDQRGWPMLCDLARDGDLDLALVTTANAQAFVQFNSSGNDHRRMQASMVTGAVINGVDGKWYAQLEVTFEDKKGWADEVEFTQWTGTVIHVDGEEEVRLDSVGIDSRSATLPPASGLFEVIVEIQGPLTAVMPISISQRGTVNGEVVVGPPSWAVVGFGPVAHGDVEAAFPGGSLPLPSFPIPGIGEPGGIVPTPNPPEEEEEDDDEDEEIPPRPPAGGAGGV